MTEKAIPGKKCWECGDEFEQGDHWFYYYHGDQDDRVCVDCAKELKHGDTAYEGLVVFNGDEDKIHSQRELKRDWRKCYVLGCRKLNLTQLIEGFILGMTIKKRGDANA